VALAIGAHQLVYDVNLEGTSPLSTSGLTTQASGSTFLLVAFTPTGHFGSVSDNKSNSYTQVGTTQLFWDDGAEMRVFRCINGTGGSNHVFSLNKTSGNADAEATLIVVEITGGVTAVDDYAQAYDAEGPLTAGNVDTTASGSMLLLLAGPEWGGPSTFTAGYTKLDELTDAMVEIAAVSAYKLAGAAGSYEGVVNTMYDGPGPIFLVALKAGSSAITGTGSASAASAAASCSGQELLAGAVAANSGAAACSGSGSGLGALSTVSLAEILPANLVSDPFVAALIPVFDEEFRLLVADTAKILLLADLAHQPDAVLDELAWQFRVDLYDQSMTLGEKRELIASALYWHSVKGTPHAIERVISIVFGEGTLEEWFEYSGEPFHFRVQLAGGQFPDGEKYATFVRLAGLVKRASAILEVLMIQQSGEQAMFIGGAMQIGQHITLGSA